MALYPDFTVVRVNYYNYLPNLISVVINLNVHLQIWRRPNPMIVLPENKKTILTLHYRHTTMQAYSNGGWEVSRLAIRLCYSHVIYKVYCYTEEIHGTTSLTAYVSWHTAAREAVPDVYRSFHA